MAFAFLGVELVGVTAGEAENPQKVLPSAINAVVWRILIFYIGALVVIMSLVPWNQLDPKQSPFVMVFDRIGIPAAGGSSTSSSSRRPAFLQQRHLQHRTDALHPGPVRQAPRFLGKVKRGTFLPWASPSRRR